MSAESAAALEDARESGREGGRDAPADGEFDLHYLGLTRDTFWDARSRLDQNRPVQVDSR